MERKLAELRRYKNEEVLRIAMHDIAGSIRLSSVAEQLSDLAEALLGAALDLAEEEARAKGRMPPGRLTVMALGKLGGRELGYHSDLDLIFLYPATEPGVVDAPGQTPAHILYARLAERFLSFLQMPLREGLLYKIDTRLRPSGNQGALVTSDQGFAALPPRPGRTAPRPAASSGSGRRSCGPASPPATSALFERIRRDVLDPVLFGAPATTPRRRSPPRSGACGSGWRARIGKEATRGKNPKVGRGGIVDIEFAVQYLQLAHGHDHPAIRTPSTPEALRRLREAGLLSRRRPTRRSRAGLRVPPAAGHADAHRPRLRHRLPPGRGATRWPSWRGGSATTARTPGRGCWPSTPGSPTPCAPPS